MARVLGIGTTLCLAIGFAAPAMSQGIDTPPPSAFETGLENQLGLTFSPDGASAYWVAWNGTWGSNPASKQTIFTSRHENGEWTTPTPMAFSGEHSDSDPFVSPDGKWLYFVSDRPNGNAAGTDDNIWRYGLSGKQEPMYLPINSDAAEYSPVVAASGALYFASARTGGVGQGDLYRAAPMESGFDQPEILSATLNSTHGEWNLWVSPDECEIIFEASSRPTNISTPGDLYSSRRGTSDWSRPTHLADFNSRHSDLMPRVHPDGKTLYYTTAPIGGHARIVAVDWTSPAKDACPTITPMHPRADRQ